MKDRLLNELSKGWIPDLSLFTQSEALKVMPELLDDLLNEDKKIFKIFWQ